MVLLVENRLLRKQETVLHLAGHDGRIETAADAHHLGVDLVRFGLDDEELLGIIAVAGHGHGRNAGHPGRERPLDGAVEAQRDLLAHRKTDGIDLGHMDPRPDLAPHGQQPDGTAGEHALALGEFLAPGRPGVDEAAVGGTGDFHGRQGRVLLVELGFAGIAHGDEPMQLGVGAAFMGLGLPGEVRVLHLEQVQVADGVEDLVAAEQHRVHFREGPGDVLLTVDAPHLVVDEGAGDGAVLGVDAKLQIPHGNLDDAVFPIRQDVGPIEPDDYLALLDLGVLGHDPGDVESHVEAVRYPNGDSLRRDQFAPGVDLEAMVAGFDRNRGLTGRTIGAGHASGKQRHRQNRLQAPVGGEAIAPVGRALALRGPGGRVGEGRDKPVPDGRSTPTALQPRGGNSHDRWRR